MVHKSTLLQKGSGGGVTTIDGISGAVTLVPGANITITDNSPSPGDITIAASGSGGSLTVTDGVNTVNGVTDLTFSGATVSGTTPNATLTITGGSGSIPQSIFNTFG